MIGVYVTVPVACFRRGQAREYLETEAIPPPSTCYGFLLSLVGEIDRNRHVGSRVTCTLIEASVKKSVVLRTIWRVKKKPLGAAGNTVPDYQELLTGIRLIIWVDSSEENKGSPTLEQRVSVALDKNKRGGIVRFGGLCLGESTHMVDEVCSFHSQPNRSGQTYLLATEGRITLPVWVDHVGSQGSRFVFGDLIDTTLEPPEAKLIPQVFPPAS